MDILERFKTMVLLPTSWPGRIKLRGSFRELIWKASKQARRVGPGMQTVALHRGTTPSPHQNIHPHRVWINVARTGTHQQGRLGMLSMEVTLQGQNPAHKCVVSGKESPKQLPRCKGHMSQPSTCSRQGAQEK